MSPKRITEPLGTGHLPPKVNDDYPVTRILGLADPSPSCSHAETDSPTRNGQERANAGIVRLQMRPVGTAYEQYHVGGFVTGRCAPRHMTR